MVKNTDDNKYTDDITDDNIIDDYNTENDNDLICDIIYPYFLRP